MKGHRASAAAAGAALTLQLAACGGGYYGAGANPGATPSVFTYDTYTQVMVDGWDPATEYSDGIIAMSNICLLYTSPSPRD